MEYVTWHESRRLVFFLPFCMFFFLRCLVFLHFSLLWTVFLFSLAFSTIPFRSVPYHTLADPNIGAEGEGGRRREGARWRTRWFYEIQAGARRCSSPRPSCSSSSSFSILVFFQIQQAHTHEVNYFISVLSFFLGFSNARYIVPPCAVLFKRLRFFLLNPKLGWWFWWSFCSCGFGRAWVPVRRCGCRGGQWGGMGGM